jgi:outer membrane protein TolC
MLPIIQRKIGSRGIAPFCRVILWSCALISLLVLQSRPGQSQCNGIASTPGAAADCAANAVPVGKVAPLDPSHTYSLAELIDLAERNNPRTRIAWERARQFANELGIAKSAYYPILAGVAVFADQRIINPFPKPLAPRGYVMVEIPAVVPQVTLQYLIFDFGKREAQVDAATAEKLAAGGRSNAEDSTDYRRCRGVSAS